MIMIMIMIMIIIIIINSLNLVFIIFTHILLCFCFLVVIVITSYDFAMETLYLAKKEGMINGEFAFILFELSQSKVARAKDNHWFWYYPSLIVPKRLV